MSRITTQSPFPGGGRFWVGKTWGEVIEYYASYTAHSPFCDGHAYREGGRLYLCHFGGRNDPTLRQVIPKALEAFTLGAFAEAGGQIEEGRRYGGIWGNMPKPDLVPLTTPFDNTEQAWAHTEAGWTTELTPEGEQSVIPGCERNASPKAKQLDLFG